MASECEVKLGNKIYVFKTPGIAAVFSGCISISAFDRCLANYPPVAIRDVSDEKFDDDLPPRTDDTAVVPIKKLRPKG